MGSYDTVFQRSLSSFDRLTDREALNVQPRRIEVVTLDRGMTLDQFAQRYPSTASLSTLALINGVEEGATLAAGQKVKRVTGGVMPQGQ
jgi:predicted Zn-dependent protease